MCSSKALILAALIQHDSRFKLKVFLCWHFTWPEGNSRHGDRMDWVVIMTLVEVGLSRPGALIDMERLQIGGFAFPWSFLPSIHCSKSFEEGSSCLLPALYVLTNGRPSGQQQWGKWNSGNAFCSKPVFNFWDQPRAFSIFYDVTCNGRIWSPLCTILILAVISNLWRFSRHLKIWW